MLTASTPNPADLDRDAVMALANQLLRRRRPSTDPVRLAELLRHAARQSREEAIVQGAEFRPQSEARLESHAALLEATAAALSVLV